MSSLRQFPTPDSSPYVPNSESTKVHLEFEGGFVDSVDGAFLTQNASDSLSNNSVQSTPEPTISIHDDTRLLIPTQSKIIVPEHDNHAKENELFDAKPNVDTTHDQLVQMVAGLSLQNEYSRSQLEGLRDVLSESDGFSLFGSKKPVRASPISLHFPEPTFAWPCDHPDSRLWDHLDLWEMFHWLEKRRQRAVWNHFFQQGFLGLQESGIGKTSDPLRQNGRASNQSTSQVPWKGVQVLSTGPRSVAPNSAVSYQELENYGYEKLDLPVIYKRLLIQPPIFKPNHTPGSHSNLATLVQILPRFKVLAESSTTRLSRIRLDICRDEIDTRYSLMQELGWESVVSFVVGLDENGGVQGWEIGSSN
ncbi:hypothetical protein CK203_087892 [Vitis vinifera]|uniref:Uncharacterized protein n=1 Tax=Vitis vinifera TaxID=29760 RepID=A0A438DQQ2_VITVI|nr:hypothetical protein CK203_087892 [Vitis vinifera]